MLLLLSSPINPLRERSIMVHSRLADFVVHKAFMVYSKMYVEFEIRSHLECLFFVFLFLNIF